MWKQNHCFLQYLQVYREDEGVVGGYEEKGRTCVEMSCGAIDRVQHDEANNLTDRLCLYARHQ